MRSRSRSSLRAAWATWTISWKACRMATPARCSRRPSSISANSQSGRPRRIWPLPVSRCGWTDRPDRLSSRRNEETQMPSPSELTHFGRRAVPMDDKQGLVDDVFHKVAGRYDLMNDLMSGGLHRVWKDIFVAGVHPSRHRPFAHLDVAGGTGDIAFRVARSGGPGTTATVADINAKMLRVGAERARRQRLEDRVSFVEANAEALPCDDARFDAYTIAFGIRNVPRIEKALTEAYRVLKRGGRFLCLEFSRIDLPILDRLYDAYSFTAIPALGKVVAGDGEPYRYLVESIREFPPPELFADMIAGAGFRRTRYTPLTGG